MKPTEARRSKWLTIRMTADEYRQLEALARQTISPSLSEYGRKVLLGKPVIKRYRNQSVDDFLADMLQLRRDLSTISNNLNQSVRRLHSLNKLTEIQQWIVHNEQDKAAIFRQIEMISQKITQAYQLWSQE